MRILKYVGMLAVILFSGVSHADPHNYGVECNPDNAFPLVNKYTCQIIIYNGTISSVGFELGTGPSPHGSFVTPYDGQALLARFSCPDPEDVAEVNDMQPVYGLKMSIVWHDSSVSEITSFMRCPYCNGEEEEEEL